MMDNLMELGKHSISVHERYAPMMHQLEKQFVGWRPALGAGNCGYYSPTFNYLDRVVCLADAIDRIRFSGCELSATSPAEVGDEERANAIKFLDIIFQENDGRKQFVVEFVFVLQFSCCINFGEGHAINTS